MKSEVRPAVHQPHHLVAAEPPVGAEEELAAGAEPDRADRLAFGVDDVALFAVDGDLLQRVRVVRPGVGDVSCPERRREDEDDDQEEEARGSRARPGCAAAAGRRGTRDRCPPRGRRRLRVRLGGPRLYLAGGRCLYLNWKLVRSWPKVGLKIDLVEVDRVGDEGRERARPVGRPRRLFHEFLVQRRVFGFLLGPELFFAELGDLLVQLRVVESARSSCCWSGGCFRRPAAAGRSRSGAGSPRTSRPSRCRGPASTGCRSP